MTSRSVDELLAGQRTCYELRAPDWEDNTKPTDRRSRGGIDRAATSEVVDRLADGRTFEIVKVSWDEHELEQRLRVLGWDARVRPLGDSCYLGVARR